MFQRQSQEMCCHLDLVVQMIKCECGEVPMSWRIMFYHDEGVTAAVIFSISPCIQKRMFFSRRRKLAAFSSIICTEKFILLKSQSFV